MKMWWLRLLRYARPSMRTMGLILALVLLASGASALAPWPLKWLVDRVLKAGGGLTSAKVMQAAGLALATVVIYLLGQCATVWRNYLMNGFGNRATYTLAGKLFEHLQTLSVLFHTRSAAGDLVRRVTTDSACVRDLLVSVVIPVATSVTSLVFMFAVMCKLDWKLALVALSVVVPLALLIKLAFVPMSRRAVVQQQVETELMTLAERTLSNIPTVQIFGREAEGNALFASTSDRAIGAYLATIVAQLQFKIGTGGMTAVGTAAVMAVGGWHVLDHQLSLGGLLVFLSYLGALYAPLEALAYVSTTLSSTRANAKRVLEVLDSKERVTEHSQAKPLRMSKGMGVRVEFADVSFGYESGRAVLHQVSLCAEPGQMVALVGPTGAGKSTLLSLLPRLFDPWSGRVLMDGRDVRELKLADVRGAVAVVPQEPILLPVSVAENIAYAKPNATRQEIEQAAAKAHAAEFIKRMPLGYDTIIGERGATLSAGQRQRIAIARALLKDAPVYVLDEPTSALDAESERLVMSALANLRAEKTCFVIAHRLSTIQSADAVIVLEQGKVVEAGDPAELAQSGGLYQRFLELQSQPAEAAAVS